MNRSSKLAIFRYRAMRVIGRANHWLIARLAMGVLWLLRKLPPDKALDFTAAVAKTVGPWFGRHHTALDNLRQAYPDKSEKEIAALALEMWDNMARLAAEYVFLDQLFDFDPKNRGTGRIEIVGEELFVRLAAEKKPHILFTAHLGNFELLPIAAAVYGLKMTALFRPPNNPYIAEYVLSTRRSTMGELMETRAGAAFALAAILGKGGNRYRLEIHEPLELVRDADGDIDIGASTQLLNDVVEGWVRENPGQWMWFHKRWTLSGKRRTRRWKARRGAVAKSVTTRRVS